MRKIIGVLLAVFCQFTALPQPLPVSLNNSVIIDTDCAIDDMRAISLLLARPEINIKAIILSDGTLPPAEGMKRIGSLLYQFHRNNIPLGCGDERKSINPDWRKFNLNITWGSDRGSEISCRNAVSLLTEELARAENKIMLVCLGPLTNIGQLIRKDASLLSKVERILWYNGSVKPLQGFNYECDKENADLVLRSGASIAVISNLGYKDALFDLAIYELCRHSGSLLGSVFYNVYSQDAAFERLKQNHFMLSDDLVPIYLTNPELFDINVNTDMLNVRFNKDYNISGVLEVLTDMINGLYVPERNIVFNRFPVQREMFSYDVRPIIDTAIARYGPDEWKANVMTDEFHRHLGVFSIVGAKMGIRARELLGAGQDMLEVVTYAGTKPPYSCLNDGIQVSTGATLGMGTIHLSPDTLFRPSALFTFKGRSIMISLKKEYLDKVDADINEGILKFGLLDDGYWKLIRHNALNYWLEWDRKKIFDIEEITLKK